MHPSRQLVSHAGTPDVDLLRVGAGGVEPPPSYEDRVLNPAGGAPRRGAVTVSPEYEDCARVADRDGAAFRDVYEEAREKARRTLEA